jgi:hypothetical protein
MRNRAGAGPLAGRPPQDVRIIISLEDMDTVCPIAKVREAEPEADFINLRRGPSI